MIEVPTDFILFILFLSIILNLKKN